MPGAHSPYVWGPGWVDHSAPRAARGARRQAPQVCLPLCCGPAPIYGCTAPIPAGAAPVYGSAAPFYGGPAPVYGGGAVTCAGGGAQHAGGGVGPGAAGEGGRLFAAKRRALRGRARPRSGAAPGERPPLAPTALIS
eukprot:439946-Rhodomonas_salina.7